MDNWEIQTDFEEQIFWYTCQNWFLWCWGLIEFRICKIIYFSLTRYAFHFLIFGIDNWFRPTLELIYSGFVQKRVDILFKCFFDFFWLTPSSLAIFFWLKFFLRRMLVWYMFSIPVCFLFVLFFTKI